MRLFFMDDILKFGFSDLKNLNLTKFGGGQELYTQTRKLTRVS